MDETKRNSMKLDIEAVRLSENDHDQPTETYKQVSEFDTNDKSTVPNMTRDKSDAVEDGADEKMLSTDEKEQLARSPNEVKFIPSDHSNGDAKIDIGNIEKTVGGMTKEELMKFANDPFWQRLRWTFFILFWALWVAMLAGAIWIILKAPKCSAPQKLDWYKEGPLVTMPQNVHIKPDQIVIGKLKSIGAKGVIYSLPADKTYSIVSENATIVSEVENYVKDLVKEYNSTGIQLILDLTPNYVTAENDLFKKAKENETYRGAFIWKNMSRQPNNWLSKTQNGKPAWHLVSPDNYVLSQFGDSNIDLQLNDTIAKEYFKDVLRKLVQLGVKGFRLANAKHYIIDTDIKDDSIISANSKDSNLEQYDFWTHASTTYQPGLNKLLNEFWQVVHNATNGDGLLSVSDYIERPEVFKIDENNFGFDLPIVINLTPTLLEDSSNTAKNLETRLKPLTMNESVKIGENFWPQWPEVIANNAKTSTSQYNIFLFLLPGVPVLSYDNIKIASNATLDEIQKLRDIRKLPSYQHGDFEVYMANNDTVIAYSRLKSGNPGYFVVYNPTSANVTADFSTAKGLPDQLSVSLASTPYESNAAKFPSNAIPLQAKSAVIFTYAKKS